jgi:hypothetical protein
LPLTDIEVKMRRPWIKLNEPIEFPQPSEPEEEVPDFEYALGEDLFPGDGVYDAQTHEFLNVTGIYNEDDGTITVYFDEGASKSTVYPGGMYKVSKDHTGATQHLKKKK